MAGRFAVVGAYIDATDILEAVSRCVEQFRAVQRIEPPGLLALQADAHAVMLDVEHAVALEYRQRFYERNPNWSRSFSWPVSSVWAKHRTQRRQRRRALPTVLHPAKGSRSRRARA